jgi:glycosyltransferase involved in cell wall biosynthesis
VKPRVLFIDHAGVLGGAELYLQDLARHFRDTSSVVLFEDGAFRESLDAEGLRVQVLAASRGMQTVARQGGALQSLRAVPGLVNLVRRVARLAGDYDVLFANSQKALIVTALAGRLARRPVIWNLHDILTADHFSGLNRMVAVRFGNALTDRVIVNSRATRAAFVDSGGAEAKTHIVYNGLDPSRFQAVPAGEAAALRTALGIDGVTTVGLFSRLAPWKGQHILLEALSTLPGVHALLVGGALFGSEETYEAELHALAERLGIRERVHFLGFRHDIPQLMKAVDIVVHTSVSPEPFGRVIVEGMLAGKPVVAARAGGAREIIEDEVTGLLVPPGAPAGLAAALSKLCADADLARALAASGERAALANFSIEHVLEQLERHVLEVAAG